MVEQSKHPVICKNGHPQPASNTRFCIFCGIALNFQTAQPNQSTNQTQNPDAVPPQNAQPKQITVPPVQPQQQFPNQNLQQQQAQIPPQNNQLNQNYQQNQFPAQQFQPQVIQA